VEIELDEEIELPDGAIGRVEDSTKEDSIIRTEIPSFTEKITINELEKTKIEDKITISKATDKPIEAKKSSNDTILDPTGNKENSKNQYSDCLKSTLKTVPPNTSQEKEKSAGRIKFDLKASLSRPLSYKPYTGKLPPIKSVNQQVQ
jgi:hypothetical protein